MLYSLPTHQLFEPTIPAKNNQEIIIIIFFIFSKVLRTASYVEEIELGPVHRSSTQWPPSHHLLSHLTTDGVHPFGGLHSSPRAPNTSARRSTCRGTPRPPPRRWSPPSPKQGAFAGVWHRQLFRSL